MKNNEVKTMKIEIWSDFVCPFCYIGKRNMEAALEQLGMENQVEIDYKSFQLNPESKKHYEENINQIIADKYGISVEKATASNQNIVATAKGVGLEFNFDKIQPTNTFDAHRLSHYAKEAGKMSEFTEAMMRSYFTDSLNISDEKVLLDIVEEVGLNKEKALEILRGSAYEDVIKADSSQARQHGVSGVPFFVFNEKVAISGAQPIESFVATMKQLNQE